MNRGAVRASVVISSDGELRSMVAASASRHGLGVKVEIGVPVRAVTPAHLQQIRLCDPELIVVDFDRDSEAGTTLARHLVEEHPEARIVAVAREPSRETLVSVIRAGASEFLEKPVDQEELDDALERLRRRMKGSGARPPGRVLAFFSPKGGAGSTTVATNLAIRLRELTGATVLLADLDLELGEVAIFLGLEPRYSVVDLARNQHRLDDGLLDTMLERHDSGVEILAAPYRPRTGDEVTREQVRGILGLMRERYDWIVVDASSGLGPHAVGALEEADEIFVVVQVDVPSLRNIQRCREMFRELGKDDVVRVVVNRYQPRGAIGLKDVEESLQREVYWTLSNDYDSVVYSINTGRPLVMNVPCACSREIDGLVGKIAGISLGPAEEPGILERILGRFRDRRSVPRPAVRAPEPVVEPVDAPSVATGGETP